MAKIRRTTTCAWALSIGVLAHGLQLREWRISLSKAALEETDRWRALYRATRKIRLDGDPVAVATVRRVQQLALAVVDEEEYRAKQMISLGGSAIRPRDAPPDVRGPLGELELEWTTTLEESRWNLLSVLLDWLSEIMMRLDEEVKAIVASETARVELLRTGTRLRPLDAPPSALGRLEQFVDAIVKEETTRATAGVSRPVENSPGSRGPLAAAERRAAALLDVFYAYEIERFQILRDSGLIERPMDRDPQGALGMVEGATVGFVRAPILVSALVARVAQLVDEVLSEDVNQLYESLEELEGRSTHSASAASAPTPSENGPAAGDDRR